MEATEVKLQVYIITAILLLLGLFIFLLFVTYTAKRRAHQKKLAEINEEMLRSQLEIQEQTFKTIAEEIHDNIGQVLSMAKLNLDTVDIAQKEKAIEKITDATQLVGRAVKDLRHLSKTLNTEMITSLGLLRAIELELAQLQKNGMQTNLEVTGKPQRVDIQKELILFRIFQESIQNVLKHASASAVDVHAKFSEKYFTLIVADNGYGFGYPINHSLGSGLTNMKNRATLIGGSLDIISQQGDGTKITIQLPF